MKKNATIWLALATFSSSLILGIGNASALGFTHQETPVNAETELYLAQARTYKVKLGDTLSGIAYKNGISLPQLLAYNPNLRTNPHLIRVGQVVYISKPAASSTRKPTTTARKPAQRRSVGFANLPNQRRGGSNRVGARRGPANQQCFTNANDQLRVLLPETNFGYTLQDYPTFFWYMPELKTQAERLELKIKPVGADSFETYEFASTNQKAGIMSVTLPAKLGPLAEGKEYQWEVRVYCTARMFISATGNIQRLSTDKPELTQKLENAEVEDYPAILAEAGVWYDALSVLAGLRAESPTDSSLIDDWGKILQMIGFENISSVPLLATGDQPQ
jgi:LysM repeat protein